MQIVANIQNSKLMIPQQFLESLDIQNSKSINIRVEEIDGVQSIVIQPINH